VSAAPSLGGRWRRLCGQELSVSCVAHAAARALENSPRCPLGQARMHQRGVEIAGKPGAESNQAAEFMNIGAVDNAHQLIPSLIEAGAQI
jgi:hypothetical protein